MEKWKPYLPVAGLVLAAWVAVAVPLFTAFLVSLALLLMAFAYGWTVYHFTQSPENPRPGGPFQEPTFRDVTTVLRTRWVRHGRP